MNIQQRVKMALIGFNSLFQGATEYSFDNIISNAVSFALETEGYASVPADSSAQELILLQACMNALEPIESIIIMMPTRRRMEVGVETENVDIKKQIAALRDSYQKRYDKTKASADDVTTFVIKNGIEDQDLLVIPELSVFTSEDE